jgi:hypothetical protein
LYDLYALGPIAAIPLCLVMIQRQPAAGNGQQRNPMFAIACCLLSVACLGLGLGILNAIRGHTGTTGLVFALLLLVALPQTPWRRKLALSAALFAGAAVPVLWFQTLLSRRDTYLAEHQPGYVAPVRGHVLWHAVYVGMSFLDQGRNYGLAYEDDAAKRRVRAEHADANYWSPIYEPTLYEAVIGLAREHPLFVSATVFAKIGVLLMYLFPFANLGLIAGWLYPKGWRVEGPLWAALAFSALPSLVLYPEPCFSLGFIAVATLYGVVSVNHALQQRSEARQKQVGQPTIQIQPLAA